MATPTAHTHDLDADCWPGCPANPEHEASWWEQVREIGRQHGFRFDTITLNGNSLDVKTGVEGGAELAVSPFGKKVLGFLEAAGATYKERNAIYQDNFQVVGRVMEALFPDGAPQLHDATDYNRWHIFELAIVKLTRYVANWSNPDPDSLVDMLPYLSILAAQDERIRDEINDQLEKEKAWRERVKSTGLYVSEPDTEAKDFAEQDTIEDALEVPRSSHQHLWVAVPGSGVRECKCGASQRRVSEGKDDGS